MPSIGSVVLFWNSSEQAFMSALVVDYGEYTRRERDCIDLVYVSAERVAVTLKNVPHRMYIRSDELVTTSWYSLYP